MCTVAKKNIKLYIKLIEKDALVKFDGIKDIKLKTSTGGNIIKGYVSKVGDKHIARINFDSIGSNIKISNL